MAGDAGGGEVWETICETICEPGVQVCETGFGAGHSAVTWLASNAGARVVAFDLGTLPGAAVGERFVGARFPGRLELVRGDSSWTVAEYVGEHPGLVCDVVHVDGGHFDFVPWNDLTELTRWP